MVRWVTSHYFDAYVADWGTLTTPITKLIKVAVPEGLSDADIQGMIVTAGGIPRPATNPPCPSGQLDFTPRSLTFIRENGSSVSIPVATQAGLLAVAAVGAGVFAPVVCIKLNGEVWRGLESIFNPTINPTPGTYIGPPAGSGRVKAVYSQTMTYASDMGNTTPLPVKVDTNVINAPPSPFANSWQGCVGADAGGAGCRRLSGRDHRRYIVDRLVNIPGGTTGRQSTEIPNRSSTAADIRSCGTTLAGQTDTLCLSYQGENFPSVQLFI